MTAAVDEAMDPGGTLARALAAACAGQDEDTLVVVTGAEAVAGEIARLAGGGAAPGEVAVAWAGACMDGTATGVSRARFLIASTGTAVIDLGDGPDQASATLLARHVVLVVRREDVLPDLAAFWSSYAGLRESGALGPRQAMITGPSRTADIEKMLVMPAHGPEAVTVVVVREAGDWEVLAEAISGRIHDPSR